MQGPESPYRKRTVDESGNRVKGKGTGQDEPGTKRSEKKKEETHKTPGAKGG